jgi:hypothetical protein
VISVAKNWGAGMGKGKGTGTGLKNGMHMAEIRQESKGREIRNLFIVVGSGVVGAFAMALAMLYYYGVSGSYLAKNVLLSPEYAQVIQFNDLNPRTGAPSKFVFDQIEFSYYNPMLKQWKRSGVRMDQYAKFYQMIGDERSVVPSDEVRSLFYRISPSILSLKIRTESGADPQAASKAFIEVNFVHEGDYYRIELHEQANGSSDSWAYFYHPGIYEKVLDLFNSSL